jgi:serine/threonine-protein kinase HipA
MNSWEAMALIKFLLQEVKVALSESDNSQDLSLAKEVAEYFQVGPAKANKIIEEVVKAVQDWRKEANTLGLSINEQERMASAFRIDKS